MRWSCCVADRGCRGQTAHRPAGPRPDWRAGGGAGRGSPPHRLSRWARRCYASLWLAAGWTALVATSAGAHANVVRSEPAAGAVMAAAPPLIELEFSEPLEPGYSRVQLLDSHSRLVDAGPGQVDRANPRLLRLNLAPLAADSYTAAWRVRSTADGHITRGSIPFGVGVPVSAVSLLPPPGAPEPATELPGPWAPMLRWLGLVAAAVALGGLPFGWIVWRPTVRALAEDGVDWSAADAAMTGWVQRLTVGGGAALVVLGVLFLFQQAAAAAEVSLARALGEPLGALLGGRTGQLLVGRILLAGLVAVAGARLPALADGRPGRWLAALGLGAGLLLATSLGAHAAAVAPRPGLAVAADWWHLVAMVAWLGGLVPLALALRAAPAWPEPRTGLALLVRRFTRLAYGCVAILLVTGAFSMRLHLGGVEPLWTTTYGRALLVKLALFGGILLLGVLNSQVLSPRLAADTGRTRRALGRSTRVELVLGTVLLLAVGVMTSVAPGKAAWEAQQRLGLVRRARVGASDLWLRIAPGRVGDNEIAIDLPDAAAAGAAAGQAIARFTMPGMNMGELEARLRPAGGGRYSVRGNYLSMAGLWEVEVIWRRPGEADVRHVFDVELRDGEAEER